MEGVVDGVVVVDAGVDVLRGLRMFGGAVVGGEVAELREFGGFRRGFETVGLGVSWFCLEAVYGSDFFGAVFLFAWAIFGARVIVEEAFSFSRCGASS